MLHREICTAGTRVRILDDITMWAKDNSPDSPNIYWLFGSAGSGKSTIAYTIARRFEFTGDSNDTISTSSTNIACQVSSSSSQVGRIQVSLLMWRNLSASTVTVSKTLTKRKSGTTSQHTLMQTSQIPLIVHRWRRL